MKIENLNQIKKRELTNCPTEPRAQIVSQAGFDAACRNLIPLLRKAQIVVSAHAESLHMFDGFKGRMPDNEWDILSKQIEEVIK